MLCFSVGIYYNRSYTVAIFNSLRLNIIHIFYNMLCCSFYFNILYGYLYSIIFWEKARECNGMKNSFPIVFPPKAMLAHFQI